MFGYLKFGCVLVMFALLQTAQSKFITFTDCGSSQATLQTVTISPCTVEPCQYIRDVNIVTEVSFIAKSVNSATATLVGNVLVGGQMLPLPLDQTDFCKTLVMGRCPISLRNFYTFSGNQTVPASIPPVGVVTFQMKVIGNRNQTIACVQYDVKI